MLVDPDGAQTSKVFSGKEYRPDNTTLNLIIREEGVRYELYNDPAGHATIAVGHLVHYNNFTQEDVEAWQTFVVPVIMKDGGSVRTTTVKYTSYLSHEEVMGILRYDLQSHNVASTIDAKLTKAQWDVIQSLAFNIGTKNFAKFGLGGLIEADLSNPDNLAKLKEVWMDRNKSKGVVYDFLTRRREREFAVFEADLPKPAEQKK